MTTIYNAAKVRILQATMDLDADTIRIALVNNNTSYTPDIDNEEFVNDVLDGGTTAAEFSDASYSRKTLSGISITQDNTNDEAVFDANDVTFTGLDGDTIQGVLVYKEVGADDTTPGDDPLVGYYTSADFPLTANGGDVTIQWATDGIVNAG